MAEAFLQAEGGNRFDVHSAGIAPSSIDPLTVAVMREVGLDGASQQSRHLNDYEDVQFDYVVVLCESVNVSCFNFPRDGHTLHWHCPDPRRATGSVEERLAAFRQTRDAIRLRLNEWLGEAAA